ncbi:HelD family protein [Pelosinus propionicus]|uniref:DNA helicase-2 / ATP-dependent DNA helicase PcrA n=1 Tax=Pelosinus propionicus DSM 13327 TaxID=1123291 RepID=A0A1I4LVA4_9FIRM|nr:UvrD-helicase domain-containing protein [Pelosinus propionicus]SFL94871.1 DNA helicase-2 / ATP-dependent DNA helicase PcrA [Pelosinus propionicus DSM 13327]
MVKDHPDYALEKQHLDYTLEEMNQIIRSLEEDIDKRTAQMRVSLEHKDQISTYVHSMMKHDHAEKIFDMKEALSSPYFGRVDFKDDDAKDYESFYIGRVKISRLDILTVKDILVFDWRDPVATIFYECQDGRASYDVLGKYHYSGDVNLKRQYKIVEGILQKISDDYIFDQLADPKKEALLADPFLTERLLQGTGNKLKDIVTSIRAEQNKIIRETLHQVIIIQGVAGSGKSTIGLHRLSYLLYNEKLDPQKMMVIAPNKLFLDYICELLPEIDADDVRQQTFIDVVHEITQTTFSLHLDEKAHLFLENKIKDSRRDQLEAVARLKGSLEFVKVLDAWMDKKIEKFCLKLKDILLFDQKLLITKEQQIENFMQGNMLNTSYNERVKALSGYIKFRVRNFLEVLEIEQKRKRGNTDKTYEQYSQNGTQFLASHFQKWSCDDISTCYREVFSNKSIFKVLKNKKLDNTFITEYSSGILQEGKVEREDLGPICYLSYLVNGWNHIAKFEHIVVDEAQDLNAFEFMILKMLSRNSSFTIMGDLSQGITEYRSIDSWQVVMKEVFSDVKSIYREVNYSYRSAREIVECFNKVMPRGHSAAIPVYEIGQDPIYQQVSTEKEALLAIRDVIRRFKEQECKSIGIITKMESDSVSLYHALQQEENDEELHLITSDTLSYQGGISILPVSLAKGLEFDGVIMWNASDKEFKNNSFDAKLLYVALSRPLYYLHILYQGNLTSLLK